MKRYEPFKGCVNVDAIIANECEKCGLCGRKFRKGILIDNSGRDFHRHTNNIFTKENEHD